MKKIWFIMFALSLSLCNVAHAYQIWSPAGTLDAGYSNTEGLKASYRVQISDLSPSVAATDIISICGSATKVVRVVRLQTTADATSPSVIDFYVYKRTTLNVGGTTSIVPAVKFDSVDPTPTATVYQYSVNPTTLGTGILLTGDHYALPAAAATGYPGAPWVEDFGIRNNRAVVLRGTAQCLGFNLGGQTIPVGFSLYLGIEWTEE